MSLVLQVFGHKFAHKSTGQKKSQSGGAMVALQETLGGHHHLNKPDLMAIIHGSLGPVPTVGLCVLTSCCIFM